MKGPKMQIIFFLNDSLEGGIGCGLSEHGLSVTQIDAMLVIGVESPGMVCGRSISFIIPTARQIGSVGEMPKRLFLSQVRPIIATKVVVVVVSEKGSCPSTSTFMARVRSREQKTEGRRGRI